MKLSITFVLFIFFSSCYAAVWEITYPQSPIENDQSQAYPISLLDLALSKTGVRYKIQASSATFRQERALKRLQENLDINLLWAMTDEDREDDLLPIRIPIDKGLSGWRLFVVKQDNLLYRKQINTLEDLRAFTPVQGVDWPDTKIMQANGFNVVVARDYIESHRLLMEDVADFFPRAITEIYNEISRESPDSPLRIKRGIAIEYPAAMYFFVNKRNKTLARLVETGLRNSIEDGSFDKHFKDFYGTTLNTLESRSLNYFELENPLLPSQTPITDEHLWYKPIVNEAE